MKVTVERKQAIRAQLIGAVADIVASDGISAATVTAVAERAGVTTGAIYSHFSDRMGLLLAGVDELRSRCVPPFPAGQPLPQALAEWVPVYLDLVHTKAGHGLMVAQLAISAELLADEVLLARDAVTMNDLLADLGEQLQACAEAASLGLAMTPIDAAAVFFATMRGASAMAVSNPERVAPDMVVASLLRALVGCPEASDASA